MLVEMLSAARDLGRLRDISGILVRYGFTQVVQSLGMAAALERLGETLRWTESEDLARLSTPERVRRALEELGPTFIKLGQLLSTRVDLFAPEWIEEFEKLQDAVPPVDFDSLREQLAEDLGAPPESVFEHLEREPLAAASIAQVHRARLADGTPVVVKMRRAGIRATVEADLRLLKRLAQVAEQQIPEAARFRLPALVDQFRRSILLELDLANECRNAERLAANLAERHGEGESPIIVPRVHWDWTGERVNVQDYVHGIPARQVEDLAGAGLDPRALAVDGARAVLSTILEDGFFHADPHPGNLFFLPGNRIAFVDFGMVGHLSERRREQFVELLHAIVEHDEEAAADTLMELSDASYGDRDGLVEDVSVFLRTYHGVDLAHLDLGSVIHDLLAMLRDNELALPPDLAATFKVFITLEGLGKRLHPEFHLIRESEPIVRRAFLARHSPVALARRGRRGLAEGVRLLTRLPRELRETLRAMSRGTLQLKIDVRELDNVTERLDRAASRLTVGMITSALIIGTAIVMTVDEGPRLLGLPLLGALGFIAAGLGGAWVLVSILRGK